MAECIVEIPTKDILKHMAVTLSALKKERDEVTLPQITKLTTDRSALRGKVDQILAQAGVTTPDEFRDKLNKAYEEFLKEYGEAERVMTVVRNALAEIDRKKAELNVESSSTK